jgi:hypothetical protein
MDDMRISRAAMVVALFLLPYNVAAQSQSAPASPAVEEFAESIGSIIFAAGQLVIVARVCDGNEKVGHELHRLAADRARQCASTDPRVREVADQMDTAFEAMLRNADAAIQRRGKETMCGLYRSPDLQVEVATALEMGRQLATDSGRERVGRLPCPPVN